ncbi:hypothetical protein Mesau_05045 [Mesorhizobium australicum WSM2073]|uniref:Uncharacterized protein n=2 Tax=Phyllobacteriaceae TaxID=69277 RepID=L0KPM3_MESAW|nr:hypothetical protein Mesau_05045 [Mesorhizobium australicum WSM2073]
MFAGSAAFAQAAQCSCLAAIPVSGSVVGQLTNVQGDVRMSQAGGYTGVNGEAPVYSGARIMTGAQASASLVVGTNCAFNVPANVTVQIDPVEGGMCVSFDAPQAAVVPAGSEPGVLPVLLGAGAIGGGAALLLGLQDDDDAVSR